MSKPSIPPQPPVATHAPSQPLPAAAADHPKVTAPAAVHQDAIVSDNAQAMPGGSHQFLVTPKGGHSVVVRALDETDAIVAWCRESAVPPERRNVTVMRIATIRPEA